MREALRQAQGERIRVARLRWGVGVGDATGVGGGGCPARRTSGYRLSPVRRWRVYGPARAAGGGGPPSSALRTGFDRLRANGGGKRACGGGSGGRERNGGWWWECPARRTSGYRLSPVRRRRVYGPARAVGGGGPSTGSGRTDSGSARAVGSGGCDGGGRRRPAPRRAPALDSLDSQTKCNTRVGGWRVLMVAEGWGSRCGGTGASRSAPTTGCGGVGDARGVVGGVPRPCPSGFLPSQE